MNKAYREYKVNGWWIASSEYYNDWDLTPIFKEEIDKDSCRTDHFRNNECVRIKTIREAKAWVKTGEAKQLKEKYETIEIKE